MRCWFEFDAISAACDITSFAPPSSPTAPLEYDINGTDLTLTIPSWTGSCDYTETLTFSPNLDSYSWISIAGRIVTISASDSSLHGTS